LRTLVRHGRTGFLVDERDPGQYAAFIDEVLDRPELARGMGQAAAHGSWDYTWSTTAARLRRLYADLTARSLVTCA
jgi:D-inositol-3-phosphate glycosyltransferase